MDPISWIVTLIVGVALNVASYLLTPKTKTSKPDAVQDMDNPTAEAGREIPVVFGTMCVKSPNCLWFGDKSTFTYTVTA